jgi:hypothetical protein
MQNMTFNAEDIFEDIPGDPDNVIMKFPPALLESLGWIEGDVLSISVENGNLSIKKKD